MDGLFDPPTTAPAAGTGAGTLTSQPGAHAPLAVRMRPQSLEEIVGQEHLLGPGSPLRRLISGSGAASVLLYGPPGTGKTTMAALISRATGGRFEALSALSAGVKEVRAVIDVARRRLIDGQQTVLFIDEVHRFSKTQQDALLDAVENRIVLLVAATTENPSFSVVAPLLSRSLVLRLRSLSDDDIREVLGRAVADPRGLDGRVEISDTALDHLVAVAGGDARRALTALEASADAALRDDPGESGADGVRPVLELADVEAAIDRAAVRYDRDGDQHYDITSAFIKSIRGSDVDAALHYLARMIAAGEDPRFIARRLMIHASEDIGMADPMALQTAVAAAQVVALVGMPEAKLALAQATIHLATAPKSAGVVSAIGAALADVE
ncbi:replication-associated recombination protein A, partial [Gordonia rhizosphera]